MLVHSASLKDTEAIAKCVASLLLPGDFIALRGGLGAGKTAFVRGLVGALGYDEVSSPTFSIVHEYKAKIPVLHMDLYRLGSEEDLYELGYEHYLTQNAAIVIEWPERAERILPKDHLEITLKTIGEEERNIELQGYGNWKERLKELKLRGEVSRDENTGD